jgi:hypothetical protein
VGRAPLDETTVRLLEDHHPDIQFDWPQILRGDEEKEPPYPGPPPTPVSAPPPLPTDPINPAHAQLGSEGLARLRARYGELMAAIARRVTDPERQDRLRDEAARLNPDNWVTDDEVRQALEQYEAVFESLRGVIAGSGRRRRRRRPGGAGPEPGRADHHRTEPGRTDSGGADPGRPVAASGPTGPPGPGDRSPSGPAGPDRGPSQN